LALEYLLSRGVQKKTIEDHLIGFTHLTNDRRFLFSELSKIYSPLEIINSKLAKVTKEGEVIDYFDRGRIVFPIYEKGSVIGMVGRTILDSCPLRYKTLQFESKLIFNLDSLLYSPDRIYLVEGVIDALSLLEVGIPALGVLGTTNFGIETANKLRHFCGDIICLFDTDENESGQKGRDRLLGILYSVGLRRLYYKELPLHKGKKLDINNLFLNLDRDSFRQSIESLELKEYKSVPRSPERYSRGKSLNIPILDLVQSHVELTQEGEYRYRGLCPFHADSAPSFIVSTEHNRFHCFGCGERGSALDFYRKINNLDEKEAYKRLMSDFLGSRITDDSNRSKSFRSNRV